MTASDSRKFFDFDRDLFFLRRDLSFLARNFASKSLLFNTAEALLLFLGDIQVVMVH